MQAAECFAQPGSCPTPSVHHQALIHTGDLQFTQSAPPEALDDPHLQVHKATAVDTNGDGLDELLLASVWTPFPPCSGCSPAPFSLFERGAQGWEQTEAPGLTRDISRSMHTLIPGLFDTDSNEDVAVVGVSGLRMLWGTPSATNSPGIAPDVRAPTFSQNMMEPVVADLNGDGHPDMVIKTWADTSQDEALILVLLNDGTGAFSYHPETMPDDLPLGNQGAIVPFDMDGDGDLDLAVSQIGPLLLLENEITCSGNGGCIHLDQPPGPGSRLVRCRGHLLRQVPCPVLAPSGGRGRSGRRWAVPAVSPDGRGLRWQRNTRSGHYAKKRSNGPVVQPYPGDRMRCGLQRGVPPARLLSARWDRGIQTVFPVTDTHGFSTANRLKALHPFPVENGLPGVIAVSTPEPGWVGPSEALFLNGITSPLPQAIPCTDGSDCPAGPPAPPHLEASQWKTCSVNGQQIIEGGWFDLQPGAFPPRGTREAGG